MRDDMLERERLKGELTESAKALFVAGHVDVVQLERMLDVVNAGGGFATLPVAPYWRECPIEDLMPIFGEPLMETIWR